MSNGQKLIVMSADALTDADMPLLKSLPGFSAHADQFSGVERLRSVYPTVTYPAHATIATGAYPNKHGVVDNSELHIGMLGEMPWNWFHCALRVEDIFTAAKRAGHTTAAVFWPSTGNHPDIDYLVDEYWPQDASDTVRSAFARSGSSREVLEKIVDPYLPGLKIREHPQTDEFAVRCACDMIRAFQPDLLMLHPANIDGYRHQTGLFSDKVRQGVYETDRWFAELVQATRDAGVFERTNFVLMSDHGQLEIKRWIALNPILADHGLLTLRPDGTLASWDAFVKSTGLSAQVYLRDETDQSLYERVAALLRHWAAEGIYGVSKVFTRAEIDALEHLSGDFSFVLETDGFTSFSDRLTRPLVGTFDASDYRTGRATHGYLPDKGPQPVFYAFGPAFARGITLARRNMVDIAPTFAAVLGASLPQADGSALTELLANA